jgi:hypothetical protein
MILLEDAKRIIEAAEKKAADIGQPMNLQFDAAGRLWATSSLEYPYPAQGPGVERH